MKNQLIQDRFEAIFQALPKEKPKFGPIFRGWLENEKEGYKVYIRITNRFINSQLRECVDLSNIEVLPEFQNTGIFSSILSACENEAKNRNAVVFVESVLNDIVANKLIKEGYNKADVTPDCYWKDLSSAPTHKTSYIS
jgi:GNAT superfamily N-acetyltransferase